MRCKTVSITELEEAALERHRAARYALDDANQADGSREREARTHDLSTRKPYRQSPARTTGYSAAYRTGTARPRSFTARAGRTRRMAAPRRPHHERPARLDLLPDARRPDHPRPPDARARPTHSLRPLRRTLAGPTLGSPTMTHDRHRYRSTTMASRYPYAMTGQRIHAAHCPHPGSRTTPLREVEAARALAEGAAPCRHCQPDPTPPEEDAAPPTLNSIGSPGRTDHRDPLAPPRWP